MTSSLISTMNPQSSFTFLDHDTPRHVRRKCTEGFWPHFCRTTSLKVHDRPNMVRLCPVTGRCSQTELDHLGTFSAGSMFFLKTPPVGSAGQLLKPLMEQALYLCRSIVGYSLWSPNGVTCGLCSKPLKSWLQQAQANQVVIPMCPKF